MSPDTTPERAKQAKPALNEMPDLRWWNGGSHQALEGWAQSSASLMRSTVEVAQEIATFYQKRLQANMDALTAMASCRSPDELVKLQQTFAQNATTDCLNEANKLTAQVAGLLCSATTSLRGQSANT